MKEPRAGHERECHPTQTLTLLGLQQDTLVSTASWTPRGITIQDSG